MYISARGPRVAPLDGNTPDLKAGMGCISVRTPAHVQEQAGDETAGISYLYVSCSSVSDDQLIAQHPVVQAGSA